MGPCLFCLTTDGEPSVEHVIPLGLGPHADVVLPAEAVCRECNVWLGQQIDEPFMQLFEVQLIRGMHRVPDRKLRTVDAIELADGTGTLTFGPDGQVQLQQYVQPGEEISPTPAVGETLKALVQPRRTKLTAQRRRTVRALLKMALGIVYHEQGPDVALHEDFDVTRAIVLGAGAPTWLMLLPKLTDLERDPDLQVTLRYDVPGTRLAVEFGYGAFAALAPVTLDSPVPLRTWAEERGMRIGVFKPVAEPYRPSRSLRRLLDHERITGSGLLAPAAAADGQSPETPKS